MDEDLITRLAREAGFRVMDSGSITVWPERGEMPDLDPLVRSLITRVADECAKIAETTGEGSDRHGLTIYAESSAEAIRAEFKESQ